MRRLFHSAVTIGFVFTLSACATSATLTPLPAPTDTTPALVSPAALPTPTKPPQPTKMPITPPQPTPALPIVCACATDIASAAPFGSFAPASVKIDQPGFAAEWFVAPSQFNMPLQVFITPKGELLVMSVRDNGKLWRVADDGTVTLFAQGGGYLGDIDAQGNIYTYSSPNGVINRISSDGTVSRVVESPEITSACSSALA